MLDNIDLRMLEILQDKFPITHRPFLLLSKELGLSEAKLIERIKYLKTKGYIREIRPIIDAKRFKIKSILCALSAPQDKIERIANIINSFDEVSHNYERQIARSEQFDAFCNKDIPYNLWFTVSGKSKLELKSTLAKISKKIGLPVKKFDTLNVFKIGVRFDIFRSSSDSKRKTQECKL